MITYTDPKMTAMQAAERFAATFWCEPREIGKREERCGALLFTLVGGTRWYMVFGRDNSVWEIIDNSVWEILPTETMEIEG